MNGWASLLRATKWMPAVSSSLRSEVRTRFIMNSPDILHTRREIRPNTPSLQLCGFTASLGRNFWPFRRRAELRYVCSVEVEINKSLKAARPGVDEAKHGWAHTVCLPVICCSPSLIGECLHSAFPFASQEPLMQLFAADSVTQLQFWPVFCSAWGIHKQSACAEVNLGSPALGTKVFQKGNRELVLWLEPQQNWGL